MEENEGEDPTERRTIDNNDEQILQNAAENVLEPKLLMLLKELSAVEIAIQLICAYITDRDTLAQIIADSNRSACLKLRPELIPILKSKLETRALLLLSGISKVQWFDQLCEKYPTITILQNQSWSVIQSVMEGTSFGDVDNEGKVLDVWCRNKPIRSTVIRHKLPPSIAEALEKKGITHPDQISHDEANKLANESNDPKVKARILCLWSEESAEGKNKHSKSQKQQERQKQRVDEANTVVKNLRDELMTDVNLNRDAIQERLRNVSEKLNINKWQLKKSDMATTDKLREQLAKIENDLSGASTDLDLRKGSYKADEEMISRASAGLALYGVYLGVDALSFGRKAGRPILDQPEYCPIQSPSCPNLIELWEDFSSIESGSNFRGTMESAGKTLAIGLKAGGWGFSASGEHKKLSNKDKSETQIAQEQTTSATTMLCQIVYVGAFRIPKSQMKLTIDAESDAKAITTITNATQFLSDYGSHVSDGTHHLGGILWRIIEIRSKVEYSFHELKQISSKQISKDANIGYSGYGFSGGVSVSMSDFTVTGLNAGSESRSIQAEVRTKVEVCGPSTTNPALFNQILQSNNKTWHVVDRSGFESLIPVWKIMETSPVEEIQQAAEMVRKAWIQRAHTFGYISEINQELQRARIDTFSPSAENASANKNWFQEELRQQSIQEAYTHAEQLTKTISNIDLNTITAHQLHAKIADLFKELFYLGFRSHTDIFLKLMKGNTLPAFIKSIANHRDQPKMLSTQKFFKNFVFSSETKEILEHDGVELHEDIIRMLDCKLDGHLDGIHSSEDIWEVPSVPLQELPVYLIQLKSELMDGIKRADIHKLNQRINDILSKNIREYGENNRIEKILISRYGWQDCAFTAHFNEEHIDALIQDLKACSSMETETNVESDIPLIFSQRADIQRHFIDDKLKSYSALLVDRPIIPSPTDRTANIWLLDTLRHRLELKPQCEEGINTHDNDSDDFFNLGPTTSTSNGGISLNTSVYDILLDLVDTFNVTGRLEIFQLLLERRAAVPLLVEKSTNKFSYHGPLLDLVQVNIGKDRLKLGKDSDLLRVAVISNRPQSTTETNILIKNMFRIHTLHKVDEKPSRQTTIAELGIGFLNNEPCLVLHVIGDWKPLRLFIKIFAHWVLIEDKSTQSDRPSETAKTIVWDYSANDANDSMERLSEPYKHYLIRGTVSIVSSNLRAGLIKAQNKHKKTQNKTSIPLDGITIPGTIESDLVNPIAIPGSLRNTQFSTLRTVSFILQNSFKEQATSELQLFSTQALNNPAHKALLEQNIERQKKLRIASMLKVEQLDIIKLFLGILHQPNQVTRILACRRFEEVLCEHCESNFEDRHTAENRAWLNYEDETKRQKNLPSAKTEQETTDRKTLLQHYTNLWHQARIATNNSIVTLEHCWRELSHLYVANEKRYRQLPFLASRHLRDGFNLELLDGDAAMINIKWIKAILIQLEKELLIELPNGIKRKPRIFVLSILGVQSSGKSTFLNLMFGVRFRSSVGMCTRGVNMQLIKVDDRREYDFILILDTEGLRAPEFANLPNSRLRDNRMATLALLPADATIILNKGETDEAIKELLPVVVKAYLDSKLAENNGGQLSTSVFFVYNQIDTSQAHLLQRIENKLVLALREESDKAVTEWQAEQQEFQNSTGDRIHPQTCMDSAFRDFKHDVNDKKSNDIRVLGYLKCGDAPDDLPNTAYGRDILELREHIHSRVTSTPSWTPKDLSEIANYIELVWECIKSSNFQLNFGTAVQRIAHAELEQKMSEIERKLNQKYDTHFRIYETEISSLNPSNQTSISTLLDQYITKLESDISSTRGQLSTEVTTLLNSPRWNQWQIEKLSSWNATIGQQKRHWRYLLSEKINGVLQFQKYIDEYKNAMYNHAKQLFAGNSEEAEKQRAWPIEEKKKKFNEVFSTQLEKARQEHRPTSEKVAQNIYAVYSRNQSVQSKFPINNKQGTLRRIWDDAKRFTGSFGNTVHQVIVSISGGSIQQQRDEQFLQNILHEVKCSIQGRKHYSDTLVQDAIEITEKKLQEKKIGASIHEAAHTMVSSFLVSYLTDIQKNWDAQNSVSVRFEQERDQLWTYFENVSNNLKDFALLSKTLTTMFTEYLPNAFNESLAISIYDSLRGQNWLLNAEILLGYADLNIINNLEHNRIDIALDKCANTQSVCQTVLGILISKEIKNAVDNHWTFFSKQIESSLKLSAAVAQQMKTNLADKYLSELRNQLLTLKTDILSKNIPRNSIDYINCNNDPTGFETISTDIIKQLQNKHNFNSEAISKCAKLVLTHLCNRTLTQSVRPRCGHPCPMCKTPCTLELGHSPEKHDTYHQPAGLSGVHLHKEKTLISETCADSVQKGQSFIYNDQTYPYVQFCNVFPDWKLPSHQTKLKLREYIFFHYHKQIAQKYELVPCPDVPSNFNHDLESIENELIGKTGVQPDIYNELIKS
ncbi:unnamed protein product [Adineta steineri]|uniref:VLIG-type G domain-containing protein n=1 Tax=Adineta steineri TaxID=433720 RepID=A0A819EVG6_9BILA|nr:unnamed protein product [Adineta steineri]CAF3858234.1 unnamed protein product [Adineta steineri]